MSAAEKQYHAGTTAESTVARKSSMTPVLLSPKDVAGRLGVCERTAKRIMMELPHILVRMDLYRKKASQNHGRDIRQLRRRDHHTEAPEESRISPQSDRAVRRHAVPPFRVGFSLGLLPTVFIFPARNPSDLNHFLNPGRVSGP